MFRNLKEFISTLPLLWPAIALLFVSLLASTSSIDGLSGSNKHRREVIVAHHGVVATDDGRCSKIGMDVLKAGGHAVDASVAAALCLGVVSPASSGIGGGSFMLIRQSDGKAQALDMRETAPAQASENMYGGNDTLKRSGILSVAVPGGLAGLFKAWEQHGKLPWRRLVWPAEALARGGFKIGDLCRNKKLAETLRKISKYGLKAFYNGSVGFNLVRDIQKAGGILTIKDLQRYEVKVREPITANILGLKLIGMPPPSSGGATMMLVLNILAQYEVPSGLSGSLGIHRQIEALKHGFAVRMNLGDPEYINVSEVVSDMLSPKFARALKKTIYDNMTFDSRHYGGRWNQIHDHGTSHLSIVDHERNAVSMTTTVNAYFGAQILSPSTGIVLNNEMDDFSMPMNGSKNLPPPAPANFIRPGKRPLSSMTPTIVLKDEKLIAVLGASGGANIIGGITGVLLNHFVRGMDPLSAVMAPRVYQQLIPNIVYYENWTTVIGDHFEIPGNIRASLRKKGHVLESMAGGTICQFIVQEFESIKENEGVGELVGVSDPRKGGFPAGF
ncbi:hypothetical protein AB3S75_002551 [Citrus x aurantiifolia]